MIKLITDYKNCIIKRSNMVIQGQIWRSLFSYDLYIRDKKCSNFKHQPYHLNKPFSINPSHQMIYGHIISSLYYSMNRCVLYCR